MKTNSLDFDAQALREKILDLAMRGKLVKQDPNDEPASVLLEKIKAEKAELVKEKKIKKSKPLPEITDDEKPFDIPESWEWVRLGDIVFNYDGQRIPVSISDRRKRKKIYDYYGASGKIDKIDSYLFSRPMLLISEDGANLLARTKPIAFIATGKYWVNNHAHVMNSIDIDILNFLANYINSQNLNMYITGSAQPKLNQQNLNKIIVPFPPLSEQSRIAAKIAQLFALLRKVESSTQQYAKLQTLLKSKVLDLAMRGKLVKQDPHDEPASVLLEKIKVEKEQLIKEKKIKRSKPLPPITDEEKPFEIPDSWEWVRLGEVGIITSGGTPKTKEEKYWEKGDIPWITPAAMSSQDNKILFDNYQIKYINKEGLEHSSAKLISKNSLVVSSRAPIGYVNIVPFDYTTNQGCKSITIFDKQINKEYIYYAIKYAKPQMYKRASGTTFKEISGSKFEQVVVPLPPVKEQLSIARILDYIFNTSRKDN